MTIARDTSAALLLARDAIVACERCTRLRSYCQQVARDKKAAHRHETYWGRPVPGFGDANARILLLGLAPAAHGANRTGRVFTGDGAGASGDFLFSALHRAGFANRTTSERVDDGLRGTAARRASADDPVGIRRVGQRRRHRDRDVPVRVPGRRIRDGDRIQSSARWRKAAICPRVTACDGQ